MQSTGVAAVTAFTAHREWASRPPDERFASVSSLYEAARIRRERTEERDIDTAGFRTDAVNTDDLVLRETSGRTAALTHWSFGQLATIASAPPHYLRTLPAAIASSAEGYPFPTVLDRDPQIGGLAPMSQQMLFRQALDEDWPADRFNTELRAQAERREA